MKISVIVSYCSLDKRFLIPLLRQLLIFSDDIILVYYDHLLNGTPEDNSEISEISNYAHGIIKPLALKFTNDHAPRYFHNLARWEATQLAQHDCILYLDADEIPDGQILRLLSEQNLMSKVDAIDFACYWYFRSSVHQAVQTEQCGLLINRDVIKKDLMFTEHERWIYRHQPNLRYIPLMSNGSTPFLHHFSWVRTKEEMLTKVASWGHRNDKDWVSLIEQEFSRPFNGTDFVHGYNFRSVSDVFQIGL